MWNKMVDKLVAERVRELEYLALRKEYEFEKFANNEVGLFPEIKGEHFYCIDCVCCTNAKNPYHKKSHRTKPCGNIGSLEDVIHV